MGPAEISEGAQLPQLGLHALQDLTQSIQDKLKQTNPKTNSEIPTTKSKRKKNEKVKRGSKREVQSQEKEPTLSAQANGHAPSTRQKPTPVQDLQRGKKRLRDGQEKSYSSGKKSNVNGTELGSRLKIGAASGHSDIQDEIRALGGDEDDYDLVANIQSDSEFEDMNNGKVKTVEGNLTKELQKMVQEMGMDNVDQGSGNAAKKGTEKRDKVKDGQIKRKSAADVVSAKQGSNGVSLKSQIARPLGQIKSQLALQPRSDWHADTLPPLPEPSTEYESIPLDLSERLHQYAKSLLENESQTYAGTQRSASSAHRFYHTIMSTGTLSDKISALTLSVQESPVHNMKALEGLVGLASKRSRSQAVEVLGALKDLFGPGNLLPSDRKLRTFASQPALSAMFDPIQYAWNPEDPLPKPMEPVHLITWAYEDWLKTTFFEVLKIIESWCNDEVAFARGRAVDYCYQLLKDKPEQEANLLRLLVNKLGDNDKKIASKTSFHILQLQTTHPSMKSIIIGAIEANIIFRPGQSLHAKYYATITLNQTVLSSKEEPVARKLLDIYFSLFLKLLEKPEKAKAESEATGVNKISINKKGEVQGGGGAGGKKALRKQAEKEKATTVDEDLREKMLSAVLTGVNRAIPFTTTNDDFFDKHLDTLFRVTHSSNFNTSMQALMLIQQLQSSSQHSADRFYRTMYESLLDPRLLTSSKQALYLNLLFKTLRSDLSVNRVEAFAKRLLQVVCMHQPSFTCGALYLIRELSSIFPSLQSFISQPEESPSDDEESFHDIPEHPQSATSLPPHSNKLAYPTYDGRKRDPLHAAARSSTLWELSPLLTHYHPSVSLFATRLLTHEPMPPKPDLNLNTLIHFLDRFVYKNPKKSAAGTKGVSIMQPLAAGDKSGALLSGTSQKARREQPVNSRSGGEVSADEVFFQKYFKEIGKGKEKKAKKDKKKKEGGEGEGSEGSEDEDEIWKALVGSRPELDPDEGDETGFSDLEDLDDEDGDDGIEVQMEDGDDGADIMPDFSDDEEGDALLGSEDEVPGDLVEAFEEGAGQGQRSKRKAVGGDAEGADAEEGESKRAKRRRVKNLPTFASVEEYEGMLGGDEERGKQRGGRGRRGR